MKDFTLTASDKAALDAFIIGAPDKPAPLFTALQGRHIEFAAQPAEHHWKVSPAETGDVTEIGTPVLTAGKGLTITYTAWLRIWDNEPLAIVLPKGLKIRPRREGDLGFDLPPVEPITIDQVRAETLRRLLLAFNARDAAHLTIKVQDAVVRAGALTDKLVRGEKLDDGETEEATFLRQANALYLGLKEIGNRFEALAAKGELKDDFRVDDNWSMKAET